MRFLSFVILHVNGILSALRGLLFSWFRSRSSQRSCLMRSACRHHIKARNLSQSTALSQIERERVSLCRPMSTCKCWITALACCCSQARSFGCSGARLRLHERTGAVERALCSSLASLFLYVQSNEEPTPLRAHLCVRDGCRTASEGAG